MDGGGIQRGEFVVSAFFKVFQLALDLAAAVYTIYLFGDEGKDYIYDVRLFPFSCYYPTVSVVSNLCCFRLYIRALEHMKMRLHKEYRHILHPLIYIILNVDVVF